MQTAIIKIMIVLPLLLGGCISMNIPVSASDEPASEIVSVQISNQSVTYSFSDDLIHATNAAHIQLLKLQISPGPAIEKTIVGVTISKFAQAKPAAAGSSGSLNFYFSLSSFDPEFTYTRSFMDLADSIHSHVSIGVTVRVTDRAAQDIYKGFIYGDCSRDEQSSTGEAKQLLSDSTNQAIQQLGDDLVQKVFASPSLTLYN